MTGSKLARRGRTPCVAPNRRASSRWIGTTPEVLFVVVSRNPRRAQALAIRCSRSRHCGRSRTRCARISSQRLADGRPALRRRDRLRGDGHAADRQRAPLAAQLHPARPARTGEVAHPARTRHPARRRDADRRRQRGERQPVRAHLALRAQPDQRGGRRHADRAGSTATRATSRSSRLQTSPSPT